METETTDPRTTLKPGDHVTIGKATTIWKVVYVDRFRVTLYRVNAATFNRRNLIRARTKLTVVGSHTLREDAAEVPQNCLACGCFREVRMEGAAAC